MVELYMAVDGKALGLGHIDQRDTLKVILHFGHEVIEQIVGMLGQ